jgi:AcrR family transcriptional regulator
MVNADKDYGEAIVEAARDLFSKYGYKKSTMEDIAQAARKAKSSIYYYFKSKEEIFQAVVEREIEDAIDELRKAVQAQDTPQKKLRTYSITRLQILNSLGNYYSTLKEEFIEHYSFADKVRRKHDHDEMKIIGEILNEGVEMGIFRIVNIELTAFAIVTALKGFEYLWALESDITETERSIDTLFEILFHGIVRG